MGFIVGTGATSPESARGGSGVVTNVTGNSITVAKDSNDFVAGEKLVVNKESNSITTWTWSGWVKLANIRKTAQFFGADLNGSSEPKENFQFYYDQSSQSIYVHTYSHNVLITEAVYTSSAVWSHIVLAVDTTKDAGEERVKLYIDNELQEASTYNAPEKNYGFAVSRLATVHGVGCHPNENGLYEVDGYMTDINFVDGLQLDPSYFASALSGKWEPKRYHGRYGVFGWHIIGADDAPDGDTDIGADSSGNNSDWTATGFITADPTSSVNSRFGFDAIRYTGTGSSRSVSGLSFKPAIVWIKIINGISYNHILTDGVTGAGKYLAPNTSNAQSTFGYISSLNSNGFTVNGSFETNGSGNDYVAWCWGGDDPLTLRTNNDGVITSTTAGNPDYGFTIVSYTGRRQAATSVGHGLSKTPKWIIVKNLDSASTNFMTWTEANSPSQYLRINEADGLLSAGTVWDNTAPNDLTFTVGTDSETNGDGANMIAYCWTDIDGYSSFGQFTHTGSASSVNLGWKPAYVLVKGTNVNTNWFLFDKTRDTGSPLALNTTGAQNPGFAVSFDEDGFSWIGGSFTPGEYWYAAFADSAGAADIMADSPEMFGIDDGIGGEFASNYSTMNTLDAGASIEAVNGSLVVNNASAGWYGIRGTIGATSGKWYYEASTSTSSVFIGIATSDINISTANPQDSTSIMSKGALIYCDDGSYLLDRGGSAFRQPYDTALTPSDVLGVAYDLDNATVQFYKNGVGLGVIDISSSPLSQGLVLPYHISYYTGEETIFNFGATPFSYPAPDGYKCVTTDNLSTPLVTQGNKAFDVVTYRGNGANKSIESLEFQPDFVWIKSRTSTTWHNLFDSVRGADRAIYSNAGNSQTGPHAPQRLSGFTSDGFNLGANTDCNALGDDYVAWCWKAGDSESVNVNGSIISSVRANPSYGFSIVKYDGTGSNATVGHGLGAPAEFILAKSLVGGYEWSVFHTGAQDTGAKSSKLNGIAKFADDNTTWQNQAPNSTNFSVGSNPESNPPVQSMIAYCWTSVPGFSKFGEYTGNGSNDQGPFINCGFKPAFVLVRCHDRDGQEWVIMDSAREGYNNKNTLLFPNSDSIENSSSYMHFVDNGFHLQTSSGYANALGFGYVYAAFAEKPLGF